MAEITADRPDHFFTQSAYFLTAVGNSARLEILNHIFDNETSVGALCAKVGLSQSATSQHLSKLKLAGLVKTRRQAQTVYYSSNSAQVKKVLALLDHIMSN